QSQSCLTLPKPSPLLAPLSSQPSSVAASGSGTGDIMSIVDVRPFVATIVVDNKTTDDQGPGQVKKVTPCPLSTVVPTTKKETQCMTANCPTTPPHHSATSNPDLPNHHQRTSLKKIFSSSTGSIIAKKQLPTLNSPIITDTSSNPNNPQ